MLTTRSVTSSGLISMVSVAAAEEVSVDVIMVY